MKIKRKAMSLDMTTQKATMHTKWAEWFKGHQHHKDDKPTSSSVFGLGVLDEEGEDESTENIRHETTKTTNRSKRAESPDVCSNESSAFWGMPIRRHMSVPAKMPSQMMAPSMTPNRAKVQPTLVSSTLHIVTHGYRGGTFMLEPGDRVLLVDNGDPDWKHGFKSDEQFLGDLLTFPSTCVAPYQPGEQPMRVLHSGTMVGQQTRLYRDQIVFVQPDSLSDDGCVVIRNAHGRHGLCPLQMLALI